MLMYIVSVLYKKSLTIIYVSGNTYNQNIILFEL